MLRALNESGIHSARSSKKRVDAHQTVKSIPVDPRWRAVVANDVGGGSKARR
jgi:hypothetical protein